MKRVRTKRWDEAADPDDGLRILITRYRPRALKKADETWELWWKDLGPSEELLADFHGKGPAGKPIEWDEYSQRYLAEMRGQRDKIDSLARHAAEGEQVTLLCAKTCEDPARCHRSLLKRLIDEAARALARK
jgi:uncharacterized protein YeaO (DUF488 family)